uniref:Uncharacterized protein n=1 Tax=Arundo donax TaxID=35708 RepID=A0A0A9G2T7_ARUDO
MSKGLTCIMLRLVLFSRYNCTSIALLTPSLFFYATIIDIT